MKILIIGTGYIAQEYLKVINHLKINCVLVGRGESNINQIKNKFPSHEFHSGGLENYLKQNSIINFTHFINLVNIEYCLPLTQLLLNHGAKNILLEKPGGLNINELSLVNDYGNSVNAKIVIGYNRRFFESVNKLIDLSNEDGGIKNIHFEFTEWVHTINKDDYSSEALDKWIISNSSHVIDTVFYLIGLPKEINTNIYGINNIDWHKSGSIFVGSGISSNHIPFSYNTNWNSAGRWSIEVTTKSRRYYLKPMEELYVQNKGQININEIKLPEEKDKKFKPGMYDLITSFLNNDRLKLLSIEEQLEHIKIYNQIGGY